MFVDDETDNTDIAINIIIVTEIGIIISFSPVFLIIFYSSFSCNLQQYFHSAYNSKLNSH